MNKKIITGAFAAVFASSVAYAAEDSDSVQSQINELKAHIERLEAQVQKEETPQRERKTSTQQERAETRQQKADTYDNASEAVFSPGQKATPAQVEDNEEDSIGERFTGVRNAGVGTGQYFGLDSAQDGSQLLITAPQLNKDYNLLLQNQLLDKMLGTVAESGARVQLSGTIQSTFQMNSDPFGQVVDDVGEVDTEDKSDLAAQGEFDISAQINDWWTGYLHVFSGTNPGDNAQMEQAFLVLGDLDKIPTYASAGLMFLPSGSYYTQMVSRPLTREVGRQRDNAAVLSTLWGGLRASIFAFDSERPLEDHSDTVNQWGASFEIKESTWDDDLTVRFGAGYLNDNSGAEGISTSDVLDIDVPIDHYIPTGNIYGRLDYKVWTFFAEYQHNFDAFEPDELSYNTEGAQISAANFEITYNFDWGRPSWLTANFGLTEEALGAQLPKNQYGVTYGVNVMKNTVVSFEYLRQNDYSADDFAIAASNDANMFHLVRGTGEDNDQFNVQIDIFF